MAQKTSPLLAPPGQPRSKSPLETIREWVTSFDKQWTSLRHDSAKLNEYVDKLIVDEDLENSIYTVLSDLQINEKLLESICKCLFEYRKSSCEKLHHYVLLYVPNLISLVFQAYVKVPAVRKKYRFAEACLLNIYNKEIVDEDGKPKKTVMRIPDLTKPSLYHSSPAPIPNTSTSLTEFALKALEATLPEKPVPTFGPYEQVEKIHAANRSKVMTVLIRIYYQNLNNITKNSWKQLCKETLKLLKLSAPRTREEQAEATAKAEAAIAASVKKSSGVLSMTEMLAVGLARPTIESCYFVEVLRCVHIFLYNGVSDLGSKVLQEINCRGTQMLWTDVMLMSNAMIHSYKPEPSASEIPEPDLDPTRDSTRSPISTILTATGAQRPPTTAATFKPTKLPEDIPVVVEPPEPSTSDTAEGGDTRSASATSTPVSRPSSRPASSMKESHQKDSKSDN